MLKLLVINYYYFVLLCCIIFIIVEMTIDNLYFNPNLSVNEPEIVSKLHNKQVFPVALIKKNQ